MTTSSTKISIDQMDRQATTANDTSCRPRRPEIWKITPKIAAERPLSQNTTPGQSDQDGCLATARREAPSTHGYSKANQTASLTWSSQRAEQGEQVHSRDEVWHLDVAL